jgi:hypothetical protein
VGRRLTAAPRAALSAAVVVAACAGGATPPAGTWLHPSFGAAQLEGRTVVVLPVAGVVLPEAAPSDSAAVALARLAGDALANAIESGGAAGVTLEPAEALAALAGMSAEELAALAAPLDPRILDPAQGGAIPGDGAALWRDAGARADERYFLLPLSVTIERVEPLRVRATFDGWLVDATSAVVLWRAPVSAMNPHAPSGAAVDVYEAALEDAVSAAAGALASRLARLARTGVGDFESAAP